MNITQTKSNKHGFTLLEVIVSMALVCIVLSLAAVLLGDTFQLYKEEVEKYTNETDVRLALSYVEVLLHEHDYLNGMSFKKDEKTIVFNDRDGNEESKLKFQSGSLDYEIGLSNRMELVLLEDFSWQVSDLSNTITFDFTFENKEADEMIESISVRLKAFQFDKE
ncbi:type II secretion system protein [Acidaminobacter sp. JC074]|uniref:type II secretion system protein n=1 Tax=Acidaminobacter sp. JC074 TaxID=2530199 RepID=UPI001F109339|nr:type II secretion system protein [Acidaminobacter sp. JC074]MCH4888180.1 type II secretion system protein [Acidaminobacter sp. JC074]